jgi:hypothetical protein
MTVLAVQSMCLNSTSRLQPSGGFFCSAEKFRRLLYDQTQGNEVSQNRLDNPADDLCQIDVLI